MVAQYIILVAYIVMLVVITFLTRKHSKDTNDFLLAGRGLGGWMTAFAYGTTYFSAVVFIGYAGKFGWNYGLAAVWIGIGNAVLGSYLAWKVLAKRTRVMTHRLEVKTMPEFFEARYQDKGLKLIASIIIFAFLIPYSASVYQGLAYLFSMVFHIESFEICVIVMAFLTALYLFFGGYFATALSDFAQGIIMLVGVVLMTVILFNAEPVGWDGLQQLAQNGLGFFPSMEANGGFFASPFFNVLVLVLLTSFGVWGLPQCVHKYYAVKDGKAIRQAMIVSTFFALIIGAGAYFAGSIATLFTQTLQEAGVVAGNTVLDFDRIVPVILNAYLPPVVLGIIVVLVLSASMSTLSSLSLAGASAIGVDVYKGYIRPDAKDKAVTWVTRAFCLFFVVISAVLAIFKIDAIVTLMSLSWGTLAGCFIGPYVYGLYSKKITKAGAYASIISGVVLTFVLVFLFGLPALSNGLGAAIKRGIGFSPLIGVITMAFSLLITPIVSVLTKDEAAQKEAETLLTEVKAEIQAHYGKTA